MVRLAKANSCDEDRIAEVRAEGRAMVAPVRGGLPSSRGVATPSQLRRPQVSTQQGLPGPQANGGKAGSKGDTIQPAWTRAAKGSQNLPHLW